jgi:hypothetical protein
MILMILKQLIGIALSYRLDDRWFDSSGSWEFFSSPPRTDRLWSPPSLLYQWVPGALSWGKATRTWSWPLISIKCQGQECVELYLHSPIRLLPTPLHCRSFRNLANTVTQTQRLYDVWEKVKRILFVVRVLQCKQPHCCSQQRLPTCWYS